MTSSTQFDDRPYQGQHICLGFFTYAFSILLVMREALKPNRLFVGYWVGAVGILSGTACVASGIWINRTVQATAIFWNGILIAISVSGICTLILPGQENLLAIVWVNVGLIFFCIYNLIILATEMEWCSALVPQSLEETRNVSMLSSIQHPDDFKMPEEDLN